VSRPSGDEIGGDYTSAKEDGQKKWHSIICLAILTRDIMASSTVQANSIYGRQDQLMLDIQLAEAKVFYDAEGQAQEVLISYDTYRRIQALLEQLRTDPDQGYFWSDEWQARIQDGEADIQAGRTRQVTGDNIEQALEWLDE
jgi:hypothetical protein